MKAIKNARETLNNYYDRRKMYFKEARAEITRINTRTIIAIGFTSFFLLVFLLIITPSIVPGWTVTVDYWLLFPTIISFTVFGLFYRRVKNPNYMLVQCVCAAFYSLLCLHFISISVFPYPNDPETFISLFLLLMPALFIIRPIVVGSISGVFALSYIVLTYMYKSAVSQSHDVFAVIAAFLFARCLSVIIYNLRVEDYLTRMNYVSLSQKDQLTQILNKVSCTKECEEYIDGSSFQIPFALFMIDIDNFKTVNDLHGHPAGDEVLRVTGESLSRAFRSTDIVGRYGGDEFIVLMKNVNDEEIIRAKINGFEENAKKAVFETTGIMVSYSAGVALSSTCATTFSACYNEADSALYDVKKSGKDSFTIRIVPPKDVPVA